MQRFFNYMTPEQKNSWETWFETEKNLSSMCNTAVSKNYSWPTSSTNSLPVTDTSGTLAQPEANFQDYIPHHLPPLHRFGATTVPQILRAVAPEFPEFTAESEQEQPRIRRPVSLQPATYGGRKPSGPMEGDKDFSDLGIGDMMLWIRDDNNRSSCYPFWMGKVLEIHRDTKRVRVRWYDKVPLRTSGNSRVTEEYSNWDESKWQPWWNSYPEENTEKSDQNKKKKRNRAGRPHKMAEDIMDLSNGLVLFYGFQLTSENRISKATAKRIKFQLAREMASQLEH